MSCLFRDDRVAGVAHAEESPSRESTERARMVSDLEWLVAGLPPQESARLRIRRPGPEGPSVGGERGCTEERFRRLPKVLLQGWKVEADELEIRCREEPELA